jgi:hypothetical protein
MAPIASIRKLYVAVASSEPVGLNGSASLSLRLRVRLHRGRLDRELADGLHPDAAPDRALRAAQLSEPATRWAMARSLRDVVAAPRRGVLIPRAPAAPISPAVADHREGLLGVADRLQQPDAVNPCGVARVRVLLSDGTGALYNPSAERSIGEAIWWVADGLQPCPPHVWTCPVIMKLDPEHVAWTCGRCGKIALTDDLGVPPV